MNLATPKAGAKRELLFNKAASADWAGCRAHRYRETKIDCLRLVMCPLLVLVFQGFFDAAINSANETSKAGSMCHSSVYTT